MDCFRVSILGCGSAKPTLRHSPSAQVVDFRGNLFLVDCGEGVQVGLQRCHIPVGKIGHILLSHLHGDHCLGLVGLISTLGLGQRTGEIVIHAQPDAERIFRPLFDYFCPELSMEVRFEPFDPTQNAVIYEDKALRISTIPLHHRVPCCGFLFEELPRPRHLLIDRCEELQIPFAYYQGIKLGNDWTDPESGKVVPNELLTSDPTPSRKYAYCSDTICAESVIPIIQGADLLYHEATYLHSDVVKARQRGHSTSLQAAQIAQKANVRQLVIGHFSAQFITEELERPLLDEAQSVFPNTMLANEKLVINI
ncbi:MAG: ribonuclease Z [Bacteroidales bacterium]|nr:ribonuclease Z [Candidatus Liminaster caballi]